MRAPYDRYLRLLGFSSAPTGFDGLRAVVRQHVCRVPFENISKLLRSVDERRGRPTTLTEFLDGIEHYDLGGTCYTNNPFLAELLRELGYDAALLGADMSSPNVHTSIRVRVDGRAYHVDMGYGSPYYEPMPLDELPYEVIWGDQRHILDVCDGHHQLSEYLGATRAHGYTVHEQSRSFEFFRPIIENSYRPGATFLTRLRICRFFGDYSFDLLNTTCVYRKGRETQRREISSLDELLRVIRDEFKMPRAPVKEAVAALERNAGIPLFG